MIFLAAGITIAYSVLLIWLRNGLNTLPGKGHHPRPGTPPLVSVIVAARNEENTIGTLLQDAVNQDYPSDRIEIIVVNDHSTDGTGDRVESFSATYPFVHHVQPETPPPGWSPKKWALAAGVARSKGEILLFTDADCSLPREWISAMVTPFRDAYTGMVTGPSPMKKNGGIWERTLLLDSMGQDALAAGGFSRGIPLTASGRNLAIRRKAFDQIQGYTGIESLFSGDDDLMMHKVASGGWRLTFCLTSTAEASTPPPPDMVSFVRQRLRFASKGKTYFSLPFVGGKFKAILVLIFLTNLSVLAGQIQFLRTFQSVWLLPWFVKLLGDGLLLSRYLGMLDRSILPATFIATEVWHSLYVTVFGLIGSFFTVTWRGRKRKP